MQQIKVLVIQNTDRVFDDKWLQDWLLKQSFQNDGFYRQNDIEVIFSTDFLQSDYVVMLNRLDKNRTIIVGEGNLFALQQEPFIPNSSKYQIPFKNEFARERRTYKNFRKVFAFVPQLLQKDPTHTHYIPHHPMMYWMMYSQNKPNFKEIYEMELPQKTKDISCIASHNKSIFPGHIARKEFALWLEEQDIGKKIDFFGAGTQNELVNKKDGLIPYKYSIAIENSFTPNYFTEKIIDCYLSYTMPIYYGTPNLEEYFPKNSFIKIDISNPKKSLQIIKKTLTSNGKRGFWEENLEAIKIARERCLKEYNFIPAMGKIIVEDFKKRGRQKMTTITLKKFRRSFKDKCTRNYWRIGNKLHLW